MCGFLSRVRRRFLFSAAQNVGEVLHNSVGSGRTDVCDAEEGVADRAHEVIRCGCLFACLVALNV